MRGISGFIEIGIASVLRRYDVGAAWGSYGIKPHDVVVTLILIKEVRTPRLHMVFGVGHVDA